MSDEKSAGSCLACGYSLSGLGVNRCPGCGRQFDPCDASTFLADGQGRRLGARGKLLLTLVFVGLVVLVLGVFAIPDLRSGPGAPNDLARACIGRNGPIDKGIEQFKWDVGRYPTTSEGLAALFAAPPGTGQKYRGPYMMGTITELADPWGQPFHYSCPGSHNQGEFDLWSAGRDGKNERGASGADDIKNWLDR